MRIRGLTLVETLVAVAIVTILTGILVPVLGSAKQRAANASDISNMHQLAVAQSVYSADTNQIAAMSTKPLVQGGYASSAVCSSPLDPTENGIANALMLEIWLDPNEGKKRQVNYRNSYVGFLEMNLDEDLLDKHVKENSAGGWLINIATIDRREKDRWITWYEGSYKRLLLDGSVQMRRVEPILLGEGEGERAEHGLFFFVDGTNEWKRKLFSGFR